MNTPQSLRDSSPKQGSSLEPLSRVATAQFLPCLGEVAAGQRGRTGEQLGGRKAEPTAERRSREHEREAREEISVFSVVSV